MPQRKKRRDDQCARAADAGRDRYVARERDIRPAQIAAEVASNAAGDLAKGVGDAAGTVARLPLSKTVSGWAPCLLAANGAPDCEAASVALCKANGFSAGKSVDITSSQQCPATVWLEKRQPNEGECKNEAFVSKAICQ